MGRGSTAGSSPTHQPALSHGAKEVFEPQMFLFCVWCLPECGIAYYPPSQYLLPTLESDGGGTSVDEVDRTVEKYLEEESKWQVRFPCTGGFGICLCAPPKHLRALDTSSFITFPSMSCVFWDQGGSQAQCGHRWLISFQLGLVSPVWLLEDTSQGTVSVLESSDGAKGQGWLWDMKCVVCDV